MGTAAKVVRSRPRLRPHAARRRASGDGRPRRSDGAPAASENARRGSASRGEDRRCLRVALPGEVLPHGGLQVLHHVEARILAPERMAQERNEIGGPLAGGKVGRRKPGGFRDLLLAVEGMEEGAAKLRRREGRIVAARQATESF